MLTALRSHDRYRTTASTVFVALLLAITCCSSQDKDVIRPSAKEYKRTTSTAVPQSTDTTLGQALAPAVAAHPGESGFKLFATGSDSLNMRLALIQAAEKTIDLQYYTIHNDTTSNLLLEAMRRAAARGVRVRFLIDNIAPADVKDNLAALDDSENIEIRVFNPLVTRDQSVFSRVASLFTDLGRATKRMHNKVLISDNQLAILGGRNLGDEYFQAHSDVNFKDTDVLSVGPITARISQNFDAYWNSEDAFPIDALRTPGTDTTKLEKIRADLKVRWDREMETPEGRKILQPELAKHLKAGDVNLIWAKAEMAADEPEKLDSANAASHSKPMQHLEQLTANAQKEFLVVSPYFVPQEEGVKWLRDLVNRGVKVKVLTNSLASTDVVAVHTGYKPYREQLIENGVELYEFKPINKERPKQRLFGASAPAHASLHTKAFIIDRKDVVIGSFNYDPRSIELNTEIMLVIHSPEIARQVSEMFKEASSSESSYRLLTENNQLVWKTTEKGKPQQFTGEPNAGVWRRTQVFLMSLLPLEKQL